MSIARHYGSLPLFDWFEQDFTITPEGKPSGCNTKAIRLVSRDLSGADLSQVDLRGVRLKGTRFCQTKMSDGKKNNTDC